MWARLSELRLYFLVSCCALAVDAGLLWTLSHFYGVTYLLAATLSFIVGALVAYHLSVRYVFKSHSTQSKSIELTLFVLLGVVGLAVNAVVMASAVECLHAPLLIAKGAAAVCTFGCNYALRKRFVFSQACGRPEPVAFGELGE